MSRARLPPELARRFRTGRVSLDFAHTGGDGPLAVWESVHGIADLEHWLAYLLEVNQVRAAAGDLARARALRAAIWNAAQRVVAGATPSDGDLATINRAAGEPALVPCLRGAGTKLQSGTATQALSTLARDAIDLFGGPLRTRIRVCAAEDCGLLFVDASRPGRRRWCSMQRCGARAKKRTYRARRAQAR